MNKQNMAHIVSEMEDTCVRLRCGSDMLVTLHTALEEGTLTPETVRNSLWGIFDYIESNVTSMAKFVDLAGDELLEARKVGVTQ